MGSSSWFKDKKPVYRHNQQLEELRNLQDKLTQEKETWMRERDLEMKDLEEKREQLQRLQEQVRLEQADVTQQREQLYLKLQTLTNQGIIVSPNMQPPPVSPNQQTQNQSCADGASHPLAHSESVRSKRSDSVKWKQQHPPPSSTSSSTLPLNLISATNQQKVASKVQIKQKLPFKLANKLSNNHSSSEPAVSSAQSVTSPTQTSNSKQQLLPLKLRESAKNPACPVQVNSHEMSPPAPQGPSHSRTGSSPAMMQNAQIIEGKQSGQKAGRTNTYPKLPDKFRIRSPDSKQSKTAPNSSSGSNNTSTTGTAEEEVIYF